MLLLCALHCYHLNLHCKCASWSMTAVESHLNVARQTIQKLRSERQSCFPNQSIAQYSMFAKNSHVENCLAIVREEHPLLVETDCSSASSQICRFPHSVTAKSYHSVDRPNALS